MIKPLRKRHLQIWTIWAVLIPVGIIVAWMAVPKKVTQELLQEQKITGTNKVLESIDKENYKVSLLENSVPSKHDMLLIEFINKGKTSNPSLLLYRVVDSTTNDIDKQELVGRIQGTTPHYFPFISSEGPTATWAYNKYLLYDIIKKQKVDSINFKR